ncbi:MAG: ROK family protein [Bacteroidota bacterium]
MKKAVIGIDIGGTSTKFGAIDEDSETVFIDSIPTKGYESLEEYLDVLYRAIADGLKESGLKVAGVGVGSPKGNQRTGYIEEAYNLISWGDNVPIVQLLAHQFKVPAFLLNDADAAAYGEKYFGVAKDYDNFILLTIGTGLGSGIYVNGELLVGAHGAASEVGHVTVEPQGRLCICGRHGCLETYASAKGIVLTMKELQAGQTNDGNTIGEYETSDAIARAAQLGDPLALEAFELTGKKLGQAMANLAAIFDPEAFVLSGGVAKAGDLLLEPTRTAMEDALMDIYKGRIALKISETQSRNLAVLGAASFARRRIEKLATALPATADFE